tara:strand:+ start:2620 stop:2880 length:261 start_codon:yes stop_codon:yes gene_type:complete
MKRYLFQISFDGTKYHGWQIQNNAITIQEVIQKCLSTLNEGISNINIVGCGRTDTGVHAEEFFFMLIYQQSMICQYLNFNLIKCCL